MLNDSHAANEIETFLLELRKRDSLKEPDTITNDNYLRDSIITIRISLAENIGKITNHLDEKMANFFGYTSESFSKITHINELMPPFLAKTHDSMLRSFVERGSS